MNTPKILLTIKLEGVLSQEMEEVIIPITEYDKSGKILKRRMVKHKQRINFPCVKKVTISKYAYMHFIDKKATPYWYYARKNKGRQWITLSNNERIALHCSRIADGKPFSFEVLND